MTIFNRLQRQRHSIFWLFLSTCLLLGTMAGSVQAESVLLDKVIAIVNDDIVMQSELEQRLTAVSNRLRSQGTNLPDESIMRQRVLDQLLLDSIQLQLAERAGIRISDTQLNETINGIIRANNMTLEQFEAQLAMEGESYASAREQIRTEMILTRIQQQEVDRRVRVTEQEVENYLSSKEGRRQSGTEYYLGHILIAVPESASPEQQLALEQKANDVLAELKAGKDFKHMAVAKSDDRQALNGGVIGWRKETELPSIAADIIPVLGINEPSELIRTNSGFHIVTVLDKRGGDQKIVDQYLVRHILIAPSEIRGEDAAKEMIYKLYERINSGDDFAALAKSNSDDPVSAIDGGSLDWVSPGQMVPEFEQVMLQTPVGVTSQPFRTNFGWHILQVTEKRQQDIGALMLANQARRVIHRRKYEEELANWMQEIKGEAFIEIKDEANKDASDTSTPKPDDANKS